MRSPFSASNLPRKEKSIWLIMEQFLDHHKHISSDLQVSTL